ncbi:hypothetical protein CIHG_09256 [Coccidioides immitis H538.4]|uniref:Uncharacterized protein n=3 Tax=Coccidioides immitis TaxID=5501 RepID=A0A0J8R5C5_COCIT|nr:hypothetical protein CIRG_07789 [Coccidioides immitis RMSCC 2394]KMU79610.1 hypothetical protein CISG_02028 [Coccidioides immitis RMSCC 3703]KMU91504.1 hypothetical protein CIHG_09256 [Coccidioides immitis H538.4]
MGERGPGRGLGFRSGICGRREAPVSQDSLTEKRESLAAMVGPKPAMSDVNGQSVADDRNGRPKTLDEASRGSARPDRWTGASTPFGLEMWHLCLSFSHPPKRAGASVHFHDWPVLAGGNLPLLSPPRREKHLQGERIVMALRVSPFFTASWRATPNHHETSLSSVRATAPNGLESMNNFSHS